MRETRKAGRGEGKAGGDLGKNERARETISGTVPASLTKDQLTFKGGRREENESWV